MDQRCVEEASTDLTMKTIAAFVARAVAQIGEAGDTERLIPSVVVERRPHSHSQGGAIDIARLHCASNGLKTISVTVATDPMGMAIIMIVVRRPAIAVTELHVAFLVVPRVAVTSKVL